MDPLKASALIRINEMREYFNDDGKAMIDEMMDLAEAEINRAVEQLGRHHFIPIHRPDPNWLEKMKDRLRLLCFWRIAHGMQPGSNQPWPLLLMDKEAS